MKTIIALFALTLASLADQAIFLAPIDGWQTNIMDQLTHVGDGFCIFCSPTTNQVPVLITGPSDVIAALKKTEGWTWLEDRCETALDDQAAEESDTGGVIKGGEALVKQTGVDRQIARSHTRSALAGIGVPESALRLVGLNPIESGE
jgi:hypothetical protein